MATSGAETARPIVAARLRLTGRVQGVGFRPFVWRLAQEHDLAGSVRNLLGEVEVVVEGASESIDAFADELISKAPSLAQPRLVSRESIAPTQQRSFVILESAVSAQAHIFIPPDLFTCPDCLRELGDPRDRRFGYPFINCTQCGPRYTLITDSPYDRANTTMASFPLCEACGREYAAPDDRRFHAEPVACPACGPQVLLIDANGRELQRAEAIARAVELLRSAAVLAVKGVGGYHLMCDARSAAAVRKLRERKHRPDKPLAVLFPQRGGDDLDAAREHVVLESAAAEALCSPARPIVLASRRPDSSLAAQIAPGLDEVGVFLPYSPLHHLLLQSFDGPLVATSGNVSGEPVLCDNREAQQRLDAIADAFLHHNRPIERPADDSVVRVIARRARPLRLGRGLAPVELPAPCRLDSPMLAVGGHLKNTIALAWDDRIVISPHIGDMGTVRSERVFAQVVADLQRLYRVQAQRVVCDAHPGYATTQWAQRCGLPVQKVLHHHAHASSLAGERNPDENALMFTWDGVGFGGDGSLWGGETFVGRPGAWRRVASLRPFRLPGGDRAGRSPWRSAAALCWEADFDWAANPADPLVQAAWRRHVNAPVSTAVGRVFDALAAIVLGTHETSFEGQGPMQLEACAQIPCEPPTPLPMAADASGVLRVDWAPLVACALNMDVDTSVRAGLVHAQLAATVVEAARRIRAEQGVRTVGLTGGVFQNRKLTELAAVQLEEAGFTVWLNERVPCNDGGLSYGQIVEACWKGCRL